LPPERRAEEAMPRRPRRRDEEITRLRTEVETLRNELEEPRGSDGLPPGTTPGSVPFLSFYPPGHFYSPVPDMSEVQGQADLIFAAADHLPGVSLREADQLALFGRLCEIARDVPLPQEAGGYFKENTNYGVGDALMLQSMLRLLRPKRYVEVGSGWTTALAVDTNEAFLDGAMKITAIDPSSEVLRSTLVPPASLDIVERPVQEVALEVFSELDENDVLFVDCSHVVKVGSDAHYIVTKLLPQLSPGVHVHIHDIFWPFEYLRHWVFEGRAWNEAYLVHAFLLFNDAFEIELFNHWLAERHRDVIERELPAMLENPGGALWIRRSAG